MGIRLIWKGLKSDEHTSSMSAPERQTQTVMSLELKVGVANSGTQLAITSFGTIPNGISVMEDLVKQKLMD